MISQTFAASEGILKSIGDFIPGGIQNLLNLGLGLGAILAFGTIIYAGILYTVSGDDSSKQKEARAWIWAAVQGLALLAFGFIVFNLINPKIVQMREIEIPLLQYDDPNPPDYANPSVHISFNPGSNSISSPLLSVSVGNSIYGTRCHPVDDCCKTHTGIDLGASCGTPVYAVSAGIARRYSDSNGYGNYIILDHGDGNVSYYAHLESFSVEDGKTVRQGDQIGKVGTTGKSTGCHLHFELRKYDDSSGRYLTTNVNLLFGADGKRAAMEAECAPGTRCANNACPK
ncbi:MAG: peptidoglycan DD-metalloendopeptidase family protein [Candidatus Colwellbacteria bacterium]|nr:peptidoglycan DD-metalloendopeptidase family protein [Candidatus Colwellbacteria bacterium]